MLFKVRVWKEDITEGEVEIVAQNQDDAESTIDRMIDTGEFYHLNIEWDKTTLTDLGVAWSCCE